MHDERNKGEETIVEAVFHSGVEINFEGSDVNEIYDGMVEKVLANLSTFQWQESGWVFASNGNLYCELRTSKMIFLLYHFQSS